LKFLGVVNTATLSLATHLACERCAREITMPVFRNNIICMKIRTAICSTFTVVEVSPNERYKYKYPSRAFRSKNILLVIIDKKTKPSSTSPRKKIRVLDFLSSLPELQVLVQMTVAVVPVDTISTIN
jgi:hypothetical protein